MLRVILYELILFLGFAPGKSDPPLHHVASDSEEAAGSPSVLETDHRKRLFEVTRLASVGIYRYFWYTNPLPQPRLKHPLQRGPILASLSAVRVCLVTVISEDTVAACNIRTLQTVELRVGDQLME